MQIALRSWTFGFVATAVLAGCGTQAVPVVNLNDSDPLLAENGDASELLPLLAVPGPDDGKSKAKNGKVTQTAAKSGPRLLPKGLLG